MLKFTADFGGRGVRRADPYAFLDHVHHISGVTGIQEIQVVGLHCRENLGAGRHHSRIIHRSALDSERQCHVAGTPFSEGQARNLDIFVNVGERDLVFLFQSEQQFAVRIQWPCVRFVLILGNRNTPDLRCGRVPVNTTMTFR